MCTIEVSLVSKTAKEHEQWQWQRKIMKKKPVSNLHKIAKVIHHHVLQQFFFYVNEMILNDDDDQHHHCLS